MTATKTRSLGSAALLALIIALLGPTGAALDDLLPLPPEDDLPLDLVPEPGFVMRCEGTFTAIGLYTELAPFVAVPPGSSDGIVVFLFAGQETLGYFAADGPSYTEPNGRPVYPYVFLGGTNDEFAYCRDTGACSGIDWLEIVNGWVLQGVSSRSELHVPCADAVGQASGAA